MRILALEPYYGGSHRAFLDGWLKRSRHDWTLLTLPAAKWKWRMRHSAITFAQEINQRQARGASWDMIFCSDMLNLAELHGLIDKDIARLPSVVYFHENQLTYPVRAVDERDYHFAMINLTSCLAANQLWFNSRYHLNSFLAAWPGFLTRMPDHQLLECLDSIKSKARVRPPGIDDLTQHAARRRGSPVILWVARWEHDKNPEDFFEALSRLKRNKVRFRINVVGQQFRETPEVFERAGDLFSAEIMRWGYQSSQREYVACLQESDIVVSTARHEFFGIAILEAISAGAFPLLPDWLVYPEIMDPGMDTRGFFYDGSIDDLVRKLVDCTERFANQSLWKKQRQGLPEIITPFLWTNRSVELDDAIERTVP